MADAYIGEIRAFAGQYAPQNWALCNGSTIPINGNEALYSLIGTTYGGDGRTTFGLPDLRGRLAIGMGQGTGLTNRVIGSSGGTETVTVTEAQLPAHNHTMTVSTVTTNPESINAPSSQTFLGAVGFSGTGVSSAVGYVAQSATGVEASPMNLATLSSFGNNAAHANMMPSAVISYIICLVGLYPVKP